MFPASSLSSSFGIPSNMNVIMDWTGCDVVEQAPGKVGGKPVVKGTRIEPDVILIDEECGRTAEQTHAGFPTLSLDAILKIRAFAHKHQLTP